MRIGIVRKKFQPSGGAETYTRLLVEGLKKKDYDIIVYASRFGADWADKLETRKAWSVGPFSFTKDLSFAYSAAKVLKNARPDRVFSLDRVPGADIYRAGDGSHRQWLKNKKRFQPAWKNAWEKINPLNLVINSLERKIICNPHTKIIANSKMVAEFLKDYYKISDERVSVIYNGIDLSKYDHDKESEYCSYVNRTHNLHPNTKLFLFVGSSFFRKGLAQTLETLGMFRDTIHGDFRLYVLGKGNAFLYKPLIEQNRLELQVKFFGHCDELLPLYYRADLCFAPTMYDPFSNACLEVMGAGTPVITTRTNGVAEVIEDGVDGFLVDHAGKTREMYQRLNGFLEAGGKATMSEVVRKKAGKFSIERNIKQTIEVIEGSA